MSGYYFSVTASSVGFYHPEQVLLYQLNGGYQQAGSGLFNGGQADAWGVEMLIYRIEEILESQPMTLPSPLTVSSSDALLGEVSRHWLAGSTEITPEAIEDAFNEVSDRLSYGALPLPAGQADAFCYFVFLREMTHHLRIGHIRYQP